MLFVKSDKKLLASNETREGLRKTHFTGKRKQFALCAEKQVARQCKSLRNFHRQVYCVLADGSLVNLQTIAKLQLAAVVADIYP